MASRARLIRSAIVLVALATLTVESSSGQTIRNQQPSGKTSSAQQPSGEQQVATQMFGAPFYSIKDGKTSARRIQQQQVAKADSQVTDSQSSLPFESVQQNEQSNSFFAPTSTGSPVENGEDSLSTTLSSLAGSSTVASVQNKEQQQMTDDQVSSSSQSSLPDSNESTLLEPASGGSQGQPIGQQLANSGSFNQQLEQTVLDDFVSSSVPANQQQVAASNRSSGDLGEPTQQSVDFRPTTTASSGSSSTSSSSLASGLSEFGLPSRQQQEISEQQDSLANSGSNSANNQPQMPFQFTTATGLPISTSSISMSLDGMMVNSRPRASINSVSSTMGTKKAAAASQQAQPVARFGDQFGLSSLQAEQNLNQNQAAKASRRVPFSGLPFSSPASKGQRTKPKASNQVGLQQQPLSGSTFEIMTAAQLNSDSGPQAAQRPQMLQSQNTAEQEQQQSGSLNNANQNQQVGGFSSMGSNSMGFEQENQQQQQMMMKVDENNGFQQQPQLDANSVGLIKSLLGSAGLQGGRIESNFKKATNGNNDDMLMSVVSSADGKERRLVMIARETLDALQRYAATMQTDERRPAAVKGPQRQGKQSAPRQQQVAAQQGKSSSGSNWWPNSRNQNSFSDSSSAQVANKEVRVQTTTLSSINKVGNITSTSQQPLGSSTASPQVSGETFTQESVSQVEGNSSQALTSDTFREVPVSNLPTNYGAQTKRPQQQQQGGSQAGGKQVAQQKGGSKLQSGSSSTGGSKSAVGGQQSQKVSSASDGGEPGNKQKATNKQSATSGSSQKSGAVKSGSSANGKSKKISSSGGKQTQQQQATSGVNSNGKQRQDGKTNGKVNGKTNKQTLKTSTTKTTGSSQSTGAPKSTNGQQQLAAGTSSRPSLVADSQLVDQQQRQPSKQTASESGQGKKSNDDDLASSTMQPRSINDSQSTVSGSDFVSSSPDSGVKAADGKQQRVATGEQTTTTAASISIRGRPSSVRPASQNVDASSDQELERGQTNDNMGSADSTSSASGSPTSPSSSGSPSNSRNSASSSADSASNTVGAETAVEQLDNLRNSIPGEPQLDYPIHATPPRTAFDCRAQSCPAGYYADMEAQCQVFHVCQNDGRSDTFLCPNGTIFSQQHFVCVWWWQVDCQQSASFYKLNDNIYCNSAFPGSPNSMTASSQSAAGSSSGLNPVSGGQLMIASGFGTPNSTVDSPNSGAMSPNSAKFADSSDTTESPTSSGDSQNLDSVTQISTNQNRPASNQLGATSESRQGQLGGTGSSQPDAELNQQQQQQLELLSRRA